MYKIITNRRSQRKRYYLFLSSAEDDYWGYVYSGYFRKVELFKLTVKGWKLLRGFNRQ